MFRRATPADGVFILRLLRGFYNRHCLPAYKIPFDPESAMVTIDEIIAGGIMLVGPSSYAGAIITPCLWNFEYRLATVMLWGFKTPSGIKIFEAIVDECAKAGATHLIASSHPPYHVIARHYAKFGLTECERQHITRL
ncbi:MAG TPA: hypothetical protein VFU31_19280 [Candidatus Binatia bacterium]|nr:hypothetical protein [Candidatus Binatia bacterium]